MASLNTLPPDQRAVLELVLQRGRSYDEIAELLGIDRAGVRQRALSALDALGPQTGVPSERRALITDYLLGALPQRVREEVRQRLAESPSERAWARVITSELAPIAKQPLPEIPVEAPAPARAEERPARRERRRAPEPAAAPGGKPPASRRGGALLLAGAALIVAAVIAALVASSGGGSSSKTTSQASAGTTAASTGTTTPATSTNSKVLAQINLNAPSGGKAKGIAEVLRQQGRTGVAIVAQGLVPNTKSPPNAYAVWLYNSPSDARILGFVNPSVGTNGRLQTAGGFPTNASHFHQLLITLETQSNPKTPGTIVLQGTLAGV
jgi:hypothetical protein